MTVIGANCFACGCQVVGANPAMCRVWLSDGEWSDELLCVICADECRSAGKLEMSLAGARAIVRLLPAPLQQQLLL